jgi:NADH-quinone oxidoreductase subunit J
MLVNVRRQETERFIHRQAGVAIVVGLALYALLGGLLLGEVRTMAAHDLGSAADPVRLASTVVDGVTVAGNSQAVGWSLYREYFLPFEIASVFLLVGMIGAVVLGKRTMEKVD